MPRLLIIDDDADLRHAMLTLLTPRGHRITEAVDAHDGVAKARVEPPDLIIMDVQMPAGGAPMLLRNLEALPQLAAIPIIIVSSMPEARLKQWFPDTPKRRTHSKPIRWELLCGQIEELLGRA